MASVINIAIITVCVTGLVCSCTENNDNCMKCRHYSEGEKEQDGDGDFSKEMPSESKDAQPKLV